MPARARATEGGAWRRRQQGVARRAPRLGNACRKRLSTHRPHARPACHQVLSVDFIGGLGSVDRLALLGDQVCPSWIHSALAALGVRPRSPGGPRPSALRADATPPGYDPHLLAKPVEEHILSWLRTPGASGGAREVMSRRRGARRRSYCRPAVERHIGGFLASPPGMSSAGRGGRPRHCSARQLLFRRPTRLDDRAARRGGEVRGALGQGCSARHARRHGGRRAAGERRARQDRAAPRARGGTGAPSRADGGGGRWHPRPPHGGATPAGDDASHLRGVLLPRQHHHRVEFACPCGQTPRRGGGVGAHVLPPLDPRRGAGVVPPHCAPGGALRGSAALRRCHVGNERAGPLAAGVDDHGQGVQCSGVVGPRTPTPGPADHRRGVAWPARRASGAPTRQARAPWSSPCPRSRSVWMRRSTAQGGSGRRDAH